MLDLIASGEAGFNVADGFGANGYGAQTSVNPARSTGVAVFVGG